MNAEAGDCCLTFVNYDAMLNLRKLSLPFMLSTTSFYTVLSSFSDFLYFYPKKTYFASLFLSYKSLLLLCQGHQLILSLENTRLV